MPPLLSSFEVESLAAAKATRVDLPRALLLDTLWDGWLEAARELQVQAIICNYRLWNLSSVELAKKEGWRTLSYTVNDPASADRLWSLGLDGLITDRVDSFDPNS